MSCSDAGPHRTVRFVPVREVPKMQKWEYLLVPMSDAGKLKKGSGDLRPARLEALGSEGWEAVGLTLKTGDLIAWPVVLLKRPVG